MVVNTRSLRIWHVPPHDWNPIDCSTFASVCAAPSASLLHRTSFEYSAAGFTTSFATPAGFIIMFWRMSGEPSWWVRDAAQRIRSNDILVSDLLWTYFLILFLKLIPCVASGGSWLIGWCGFWWCTCGQHDKTPCRNTISTNSRGCFIWSYWRSLRGVSVGREYTCMGGVEHSTFGLKKVDVRDRPVRIRTGWARTDRLPTCLYRAMILMKEHLVCAFYTMGIEA